MNLDTGEGASPDPSENEAEATVQTDAEGSQDDANPADSSAADGQDAKEEPVALIDVVTNAVAPKEDDAASSTADGEDGKKAEDADASEKEEGKAAEESDPPPFHEHPRWKQLVAERDELKPDAEQFRNVRSFMTENGLTGAEVSDGFKVMAALKSSDPADLQWALEWLDPRVQGLRDMLGGAMPDDIQQKLDDGLIDEDTAKELAEARAGKALHEKHGKALTERTETERSAQVQQAAATAAANAVETWETGIKASDPDYALKAEMVTSTALAIAHAEGSPKTPEESVVLVKRAYEKVNETFKKFRPAPKPKDTTTPAGSSARTATAPPKTLLEAVEQAVAQ